MKKKSFPIVIGVLIFLTITIILLGLCWGTYKISLLDMIQVLLGNGTKMQNTAVFTIRLPRIMVAVVVGIALSTAGGLLQTVTRNDLADTGVMGINAGAALFVVIYIQSKGMNYYEQLSNLTIFAIPLVAVTGAALAAIFIYTLSNKKGVKPQRLILVGMGMNIGINAVVTFIQLKGSAGDYNRALVWTSGSLWGSSWKYFIVVTPIILLFYFLTLYKYKTMDIMELGEELPIGLGIHIEKERKQLLFYAVALAGAATAVAGNIGFLGLLAPHIARKLVGPSHKKYLSIGAMISVIVIVLADSISRNCFSPLEIPVGLTISFIGVPYFIYLMLKEK